jgi:hypothetical protein
MFSQEMARRQIAGLVFVFVSDGSPLAAAVPAGRDGDDAIRRSPDEMFNHLERPPSSGGGRDSTAWRD